jgi:hypothetical protein
MDLCVLILFYFNLKNLDGSGSNECAYHSDFLKYDFYFFYGHANFCLCTLYF